MRKIINGLRYDSETAVEIGRYDTGGSRRDFSAWEATLYRTPRSGRFFIVGEGGPQTRFAQSAGQNTWTGGSDLIPMSKAEALDWAERYLDPEVVEKHFQEDIEDA